MSGNANQPSGAARPFQSSCLGIRVIGCAGVIFLVAAVVLNVFVLPWIAFPLVGIAAYLFWTGKRLRAPTVEQLRSRDPRPPVLYLRSFELDAKVDSTESHRLDHILPEPVKMVLAPIDGVANWMNQLPVSRAIDRFMGSSVEQKIADAFEKIGPVIAVGEPGETLSIPGAARHYLDDTWQTAVVAAIREAALVIFQPWISSAVMWEIETALAETDPRRVLLVFWQISDADYEKFREAAPAAIKLPPASARRDGEELIRFNEAGVPSFASIPRRGTLGTALINYINLDAFVKQLSRELQKLPPPPASRS